MLDGDQLLTSGAHPTECPTSCTRSRGRLSLTSSSLELVLCGARRKFQSFEEVLMTELQRASEQITAEVTSWPGVEAGPGKRGEFAFTLGRREIGHLHGDHAAHFSFPKRVWADLMEQGRIVPHPVFPDSQGPAARRIEDEADVRDVIELLRQNYERVVAAQAERLAATSDT